MGRTKEMIEAFGEEFMNSKNKGELVAYQDKPKNAHFEVGITYIMGYIGDSDLKPKWKCIKLTPKTATFERVRYPSEKITRKIKTSYGVDYVVEGNYSMAPSIHANKIAG